MAAEMKNNQSVTLLRDKKPQAALDAAWATDEYLLGQGICAARHVTRKPGLSFRSPQAF